ncbi:MAG: potassium channel family protein [Bacteroidota bacterium]
MKEHSLRSAYLALSLLFTVIVIGVIGYYAMGFTLTEAIYQTIITVATVGFEEVHPLSPAGMWFTSLLVIFSFGIFAYAVSTFTRYLVEGVFRNTLKDNKVKRKIQELSGHVVICGYGRNGKQAAIELMEHSVPIVIIEQDPETVNQLRNQDEILFIDGDASVEEVLRQARLESARALITTLPVDADNLFVVLTAREINPSLRIISRASLDHSDAKLKRAGASNVIMPDKIGGRRMAKLVAQPDVVEFIDYLMIQSADHVLLEEISCEKISASFTGKSIRELDIRNESGANIIGLKLPDNSYLINPLPETLLTASDKIFALGTRKQIDALKKLITMDLS